MANRTRHLVLVIVLALGFGLPASFAQQLTPPPPPTPTLELELICTPSNLVVPGSLQIVVIGHNLMDHARVYDGNITVELENYLTLWGWRTEFGTTIPAHGYYYKHFTVQVPGLATVLGNQRFKVRATDVTPPGVDYGTPSGYKTSDEYWVQMVSGK